MWKLRNRNEYRPIYFSTCGMSDRHLYAFEHILCCNAHRKVIIAILLFFNTSTFQQIFLIYIIAKCAAAKGLGQN